MGKNTKKLNRKSGNSRNNKRIRGVLIDFLIIACIVLAGHGENGDDGRRREAESKEHSNGEATVNETGIIPWNLILVNRLNSLPEDFEIDFTLLSNGQRVDSRIYPDLQMMFDDARAEDVFPIVREGFRTHEDQVKVFEDKVSAYMREGYRRRKAEELAEQLVAVPGTSEHELGLAVDINADNSRSTNDEVYIWLAENAWRYGFILRYPQGKEGITGIDYEPWHYRYVGKEAASEIYEERITLEEYLEEGGADRDG